MYSHFDPLLWVGVADIEPGEKSGGQEFEACLSVAAHLAREGELWSVVHALAASGMIGPEVRVYTPPKLVAEWLRAAASEAPECFSFCGNLSAEITGWVFAHWTNQTPLPEEAPVADLTLLLWWLFVSFDGGEAGDCIQICCRNDHSPTAASLRRIQVRNAKGLTISGVPPDRLGRAIFLGLLRGVVHVQGEVDRDLASTVYVRDRAERLAADFLGKSSRVRGSRGEILVFHGGSVEGQRLVARLAPLANTPAVETYAAWLDATQRSLGCFRVENRKYTRRRAVAHSLHLGESLRSTARGLIEARLTTSEDWESARRMSTAIKRDLRKTHGCPCPRETVDDPSFSQGESSG